MRSRVWRSLFRESKSYKGAKDSRIFRSASTAAPAASQSNQEDGILVSRFHHITPPSCSNTVEKIWQNMGQWSDKTALVCATSRRSYTYAELYSCSHKFAASLVSKLRLSKGDRVAVMIPNCPEYPVAFLGTLLAGGVCTTVNPGYKQFELTHQLKLTEPKVIVTNNFFYPMISKTVNDLKADIKIIVIDRNNEDIPAGTLRFSEFAEDVNANVSVLSNIKLDINDLAVLLFSSGTTGLPKAVELTHGNLVSTLDSSEADVVRIARWTTATTQDTLPAIIPFFHVYGLLILLMAHLNIGARLITLERYAPDTFIDAIHKDKANVLFLVPPLAVFLAKDPRVKAEHLETLHTVISAAAPLGQSDVDSFMKKASPLIKFSQGYGLTETTAYATSMPLGPGYRERDFETCGELVPIVKAKIVDKSGVPVKQGEPGELLLSGPNVTRGYYKNEKATKESFSEDGFFKTGDLVIMKPNGDIQIKERIKELIKVKGMQVAPAELEALLRSHPAVAEAGVIGIPHEEYGEVPKAYIKLVPNAKKDKEDIMKFVAEQVVSYKKIREIVFIDELPKTTSGKILRRELKALD